MPIYYIVLEFDFDGKLSDAQVYTVFDAAKTAADKIREVGGEAEIFGRELK